MKKTLTKITNVLLTLTFVFSSVLPVQVGAVGVPEPYLVKDISPNTSVNISSGNDGAYNIVELPGDGFVFSANNQEVGMELWKSDGTTAGTVLLKDIYPGLEGSITNGTSFFEFNNHLYFCANDGAHGYELWKTDGTTSGTTLVKDIYPGDDGVYPYASNPNRFNVIGETLYFTATDDVHGQELWKTDGTTAGTALVKDIYPGDDGVSPYGSYPERFNVIGQTLYFTATDGVHGQELWKTNGTTVGTVLVKDIYVGALGSNDFSYSKVVGTNLFFSASDENGLGLWKSNSLTGVTDKIKDFVAIDSNTDSDIDYQPFANIGSEIFFNANDGTSGSELWKSDGTLAGTVMVKDIDSTNLTTGPCALRIFGDKLFFFANDGTTGREPWVSDGTESGTFILKDIYPTVTDDPSAYGPKTVIANRVYFPANDGSGEFLWATDGTTEGTKKITFTDGGETKSIKTMYGYPKIIIGDAMYFRYNGGVSDGTELWRTDSTDAGTYMVADINPSTTLKGFHGNPTLIGSTLYFNADDGTNGVALWALDVSADLPADATPPTFTTLPGLTTTINITEGQTITTNPYIIKVKPDDANGIQKVEFYVDNNLLCTDTTADADGVYECAWDTSKYHSDIRVLAYDNSGNPSLALTRSAIVDPSLYTLPRTGMNFMDYIKYMVRAIFKG